LGAKSLVISGEVRHNLSMTFELELVQAMRIATPRVELRIPTDADIEALCAVAKRGVHDPAVMPFDFAWTDIPSPEFERQFHEYHRGARDSLGTEKWDAQFVVAAHDLDGAIIGVQGAIADRHGAAVGTGSWLGLDYQGQGYGTEMRVAVLTFLFDSLGVEAVSSGAYLDNAASKRLSEKLGYVESGRLTKAPRGVPQECIELMLTRARYLEHRPPIAVEVTGFGAARAAFSLGPSLGR